MQTHQKNPSSNGNAKPVTALTVAEQWLLKGGDFHEQMVRALPRFLGPEKFGQFALTYLKTNPKLLDPQKYNQRSLWGAILESAQLGLQLDGFLGQAYLVPFKGNVILLPGYRGLRDLAIRSGHTRDIDAHVVHSGDSFEYEYGTSRYLRHKPTGQGEVTHAYAVAYLSDGTAKFNVMDLQALERIRKKSASGSRSDSPWATDREAMYRKCPIRAICKDLPLSPEATMMATREQALEEGRVEPREVEVEWQAAAQPSRAIDDLNAAAGLEGPPEKPREVEPEPEGGDDEPDDEGTGIEF